MYQLERSDEKGGKHLDWFNELVNEENISPLVRILILLITRRDEFFLLSESRWPAGHRAG